MAWRSTNPHPPPTSNTLAFIPSPQQKLPGGSVVKNLAANAADAGSIPGSRRSSGEGNGNPLQYSCLRIPWTEESGGLPSTGGKENTVEQVRATSTNMERASANKCRIRTEAVPQPSCAGMNIYHHCVLQDLERGEGLNDCNLGPWWIPLSNTLRPKHPCVQSGGSLGRILAFFTHCPNHRVPQKSTRPYTRGEETLCKHLEFSFHPSCLAGLPPWCTGKWLRFPQHKAERQARLRPHLGGSSACIQEPCEGG